MLEEKQQEMVREQSLAHLQQTLIDITKENAELKKLLCIIKAQRMPKIEVQTAGNRPWKAALPGADAVYLGEKPMHAHSPVILLMKR